MRRALTSAFMPAALTAFRMYSTPGKVKVNVKCQDGTMCDFEAPVGTSLMEAIRDVAGLEMDGTCDGCLQCSTCHVYVTEEWFKKLPPASEREEDTLDKALEVQDCSRLACQITLRDDMDGLEVALPTAVKNLLM